MDHTRYQEQISQLIDNELPGNESPGLFVHLSVCQECRGFFYESMQLRSRLSSAPVPSLTTYAEHNPWSSSHVRREPSRRTFAEFNSSSKGTAGQFPAIALMLLMLVVGGLLFSTKVEIQRPQESTALINGITSPENPSVR